MKPIFTNVSFRRKLASDISGYNTDYLARLCREKKIEGVQVGRTWLINRESLEAFARAQADTKLKRAEELRVKRGKEYRRAQKPIVRAAMARATAAHEVVQDVVRRAAKPQLPSALRREVDMRPVMLRPLTAVAVALVVVVSRRIRILAPRIRRDGRAHSARRRTHCDGCAADAPLFGACVVPRNGRGCDAHRCCSLRSARLAPERARCRRVVRIRRTRSAGRTASMSPRLPMQPRAPFDATGAGEVAHARVAQLIAFAHDPSGSSIRAYVAAGQSLYDAAAGIGNAYLGAITGTGDGALVAAARVRDAAAFVPHATTALLDSYVQGVYAWNEASPKAAGTVLAAAYAIGDTAQTVTNAAPIIARESKERAVYAFVDSSLSLQGSAERAESQTAGARPGRRAAHIPPGASGDRRAGYVPGPPRERSPRSRPEPTAARSASPVRPSAYRSAASRPCSAPSATA